MSFGEVESEEDRGEKAGEGLTEKNGIDPFLSSGIECATCGALSVIRRISLIRFYQTSTSRREMCGKLATPASITQPPLFD